MRRLFATLALVALAAACNDEPTRPSSSDGPLMSRQPAAHGGWVVRHSADDNWCGFWDADNNFLPPVPCQWVYTPGPKGTFTMRMWSTDVPNATGRAYHSGPTNYPQLLADWYLETYGVAPVDGLMPLCDFNSLQDPTYSSLMCTTNWHYTISASGQAMFVATFDPGHQP